MRIGLAFRAFWKALVDAEAAERIEQALSGKGLPPPAEQAAEEKAAKRPAAPPEAAKPARSDALTLLATLQREARLVDIVKEPLQNYDDAQVGAAARDVLRDCGAVLDRLFGLEPLVQQQEGDEVEVAAGFESAGWRLTGNVQGDPPFRGQLVHHGWRATRCELPQWTGSKQAARIVAPAEVEVK